MYLGGGALSKLNLFVKNKTHKLEKNCKKWPKIGNQIWYLIEKCLT